MAIMGSSTVKDTSWIGYHLPKNAQVGTPNTESATTANKAIVKDIFAKAF